MALTLKDPQGGIVSVHVLDQLNLRDLGVGPRTRHPSGTYRELHGGSRLRGRSAVVPRAAQGGTCDVFVSVGTLDGTPQIALPLDQEDGQRRYRVGIGRRLVGLQAGGLQAPGSESGRRTRA